jgi:predicted DNA-binding protein (MmcQ/YjbR family)
MDIQAVKDYCEGLPGAVVKRFDHPSNVLVYYAKGKKFAYFKTSEPEQWRFSVRVGPGRFLELTDVPGIKPARYLARLHWVTIVDVSTLPKKHLTDLIDASYKMACAPAKKRPSGKRSQ